MTEVDPVRAGVEQLVPLLDTERSLAVVRRRHRRLVRRRRGLTVGAVLLVAVAAAAGLAIDRDDAAAPADDVQVTVPGPTTPTVPATTVLSARHPVTVQPAARLRDGEEVTVRGRGFPPNARMAVSMCASTALEGAGSTACDTRAAFSEFGTDADGRFEVEYSVERLIVISGSIEPIDCAVVEGGCVVAAGVLYDDVESGGMPVTFDDSVPPPELPEVEVSINPAEDLHDGDIVDVVASGLGSGDYININLCALTDDHSALDGCELVRAQGQPRGGRADADGDAEFSVRIHRLLEPLAGDRYIDCGEALCALMVHDERDRGFALLAFDPDDPAPEPPAAEVDLPDPLVDGDRVRIDATHFRPGADVIAYVCPREAHDEPVPCFGEELGYTTTDANGSATLAVRVPDHVGWYPQDPADQPADGSPIDVNCRRRPGQCELVITNFYRAVLRVPLTFD